MRMLLITPLVFIIDAYAIWLVWGWHGVPIGLPAITIWRAAGVSALVNLFTFRITTPELAQAVELSKDKDKESRLFWTGRLMWLFGVAFIVGTAYVAKLFAE